MKAEREKKRRREEKLKELVEAKNKKACEVNEYSHTRADNEFICVVYT
jgi:hypothetical protein